MKKDVCSECKRKKAHSVADVLAGACPKHWAIHDIDAEKDCNRYMANQLLDSDTKSSGD